MAAAAAAAGQAAQAEAEAVALVHFCFQHDVVEGNSSQHAPKSGQHL
jgi:hypothetical protein